MKDTKKQKAEKAEKRESTRQSLPVPRARRRNGKKGGAKTREGLLRCITLGVVFLSVIGFFVYRLTELQLLNPRGTVTIDGNRIAVTSRVVSVPAARGRILDRNGAVLAEDRILYRLELDADTFPADDERANALIASLLTLFDREDDSLLQKAAFPMEPGFADGRYLYFLRTSTLSDGGRARYDAYLETLGLPADADANTLLEAMFRRYHLTEENPDRPEAEGTLLYDRHMAYRIASVRYDLEVYPFDETHPYCLCEDTPISLITPIEEEGLMGVTLTAEAERVYTYPGYASHVLGHLGKIPAASLAYYTGKGYPMDATVGIDGAEGAFESHLRGVDGELLLEEDAYGNVVRQTVLKEAVPGGDVYLTLDMELQIAAEDALKANIEYIASLGEASGEEASGADARAGALVLIEPGTGAVLASASYPTFDLTTYSVDYPALSADGDSPLLNRVLMGTYAPGSTFKVGVAAAALEAGIIEADTKIDTKGIYTYYKDYQPRCWLYTQTERNHGSINVTEALRDSCNYFFFDVGRRLGIESMAAYMQSLGLGEKTGAELGESAGILSSPAYTASKQIPWTGAATLQTAIGQGYSAFTPMQIASYLSAVVNGGTRYGVHYLYGTGEAGSEAPTYKTSPQIFGKTELSESTRQTLLRGMKEVAENGSALRIFRGYPVSVGAKTGTAEVGTGISPNAVFAAFAPLDRPQVMAVSVIENGANGTNAGFCVKDVFDVMFD